MREQEKLITPKQILERAWSSPRMRQLFFKEEVPNLQIIITTVNKILRAFENAVQMELIRVRWQEIKRLRIQ